MHHELLTRDNFRNAIFKRDNYQCVICKASAKDAHHIIERRLWDNEGYYLDNGASLCEKHHIEAEMTTLSCHRIRTAAGISNVLLPEHLYPDYNYDKWGNAFITATQRLRGELFFDESVQKILKRGNILGDFRDEVKHPRTFHVPFSENMSDDDKVIDNMEQFVGNEVIITIKWDGENTTLTRDKCYARSLDSGYHKSRTWVRGLHGRVGYLIPEGWRVCCENLYAKHSIHYENLSDYVLMFSIWNDVNMCLSFDETVEWAQLLELWHEEPVWRGIYDEEKFKEICASTDRNTHEGYIIRNTKAFPYHAFRKNVAKWVRKNHVQTHAHWMQQEIIRNKLKGE